MYMHFDGHGDAAKLARTLHDALALTKTSPAIDLPTADLDRFIGKPGKIAGGTYQFAVPRAEKIIEHGAEVPPSMGMAIAINFQPTGEGHAAITGDFVLLASEVNPIISLIGDHQMGTCRMGDDPTQSVVDRFCRLHDAPNVFVVDTSFMPTGMGLNPMVTVMANALRVGSWIAQEGIRGTDLERDTAPAPKKRRA